MSTHDVSERETMSECLTDSDYEALFGAGLPRERRARLRVHLRGCARCRQEYETRRGADGPTLADILHGPSQQTFVGGPATPPPDDKTTGGRGRHQRIRALYLSVRELPAERRAAYLTEACGADPELREAVELYLKDEEDSPDFLEPGGEPSSPSQSPPELESPHPVLDEDLQILGLIGRGGQATVYRAYERSLDRPVAVKVLRSSLFLEEGFRRRFQLEAQRAARLDYPGIVRIHRYRQRDDLAYIVMQLVDGPTLTDVAKRCAELRAHTLDAKTLRARQPAWFHDRYHRQVARWTIEIAEALRYAHQRDVVHRDIKPANVMLTDRGRIVVADFGLAKQLNQDTGMTQPGDLLGSPRYGSPEQMRGEPIDARSDIFSLGATLYEMLTYTPAFDGDTLEQAIHQVVCVQPKPPRECVPSVPARMAAICQKCLSKDRAARYADCAALIDDLTRWLHEDRDGGTVVPPTKSADKPPRPAGRRRRSTRWAVALVPVVFLLAVLAWSTRAGLSAPTAASVRAGDAVSEPASASVVDDTDTPPEPVAAEITSPRDGAQLNGPSVRFAVSNGTAVERRDLLLGTSPRLDDLCSTTVRGEYCEVGDLPTDGRTVYVTLRSHTPDSVIEREYTVTAQDLWRPPLLAGEPAIMVVVAQTLSADASPERGTVERWLARELQDQAARIVSVDVPATADRATLVRTARENACDILICGHATAACTGMQRGDYPAGWFNWHYALELSVLDTVTDFEFGPIVKTPDTPTVAVKSDAQGTVEPFDSLVERACRTVARRINENWTAGAPRPGAGPREP